MLTILPWLHGRQCGVHLATHAGTTIASLRFADDVLLFASLLRQCRTMQSMLSGIACEAKKVGLDSHLGTKLRDPTTSKEDGQDTNPTQTSGPDIEVPHRIASQTGLEIAFHHPNQIKVDNGVPAACRKLHMPKRELTTKSDCLKSRC